MEKNNITQFDFPKNNITSNDLNSNNLSSNNLSPKNNINSNDLSSKKLPNQIKNNVWYNDAYILGIILIVLIIIITIGFLIWWFPINNGVTLNNSGDIKLHKTIPDSIFLYTGLKFPDELKIYKPKLNNNTNNRNLTNIQSYLGTIIVTEKTKYTLQRFNEMNDNNLAEFIVYKFPTNEIIFMSEKMVSFVELEPGEYYILLFTLSDQEIFCSYKKSDKNLTEEKIDFYKIEPSKIVEESELIDFFHRNNGFNYINKFETINKHYEIIPHFITNELSIKVLKGNVVVILLKNNETNNFVKITKDDQEINSKDFPYINSLEVIEDGTIDILTYSYHLNSYKNLSVLIFD